MSDTLDQAAAETTGVGTDTIKDRSRRPVSEPTVSDKPVQDTEEPFIRKNGMLMHHGPERSTFNLEDFIRKQQDAHHARIGGHE